MNTNVNQPGRRNQLSFLSWNLAMLERSQQAPPQWAEFDTEAAVRSQTLRLSPDIVLLQELPGVVPYVETHEMIKANPKTHNGHLATLIKSDLVEAVENVLVVPNCGILATLKNPELTVANVHLAPGRANSQLRFEQIRAIIDLSPTKALAIIGDTNTRIDEEASFQALGLKTSPRPPSPTWNSKRNLFRSDGHRFTAYFTRSFCSPQVEQEQLKVYEEQLVQGMYEFNISDHYALSGTISSSTQ